VLDESATSRIQKLPILTSDRNPPTRRLALISASSLRGPHAALSCLSRPSPSPSSTGLRSHSSGKHERVATLTSGKQVPSSEIVKNLQLCLNHRSDPPCHPAYPHRPTSRLALRPSPKTLPTLVRITTAPFQAGNFPRPLRPATRVPSNAGFSYGNFTLQRPPLQKLHSLVQQSSYP